jgi:hypothetical protein
MTEGSLNRRCFRCDATSAEAAFQGVRKPIGRRDLCFLCQSDPPALSAERSIARRWEVLGRRAERRTTAAKINKLIRRAARAAVAAPAGGIIDV